MNGFLRAAHISFDNHLPLTLSPDDIWTAIAHGFAAHVNNHAEELRKQFVSHEGKKRINIRRDEFIKGSPDNDWMGGFAEFSDKIGECIGKKKDLLVSSFSTTGVIEKATSEIVLMDTMKRYIDYWCITKCGIPEITLLGTVEDWEQICERALALSEFKCEEWIGALIVVLDEFVKAAKGNVNKSFWQRFYKLNDSSGGPYITGAINVFFPYIGKDASKPNTHMSTWQEDKIIWFGGGPATYEIPMGLSLVPFTWDYYGRELPMQFIGGFVGTSQDQETLAVKPALGWAVADRKEDK